jgi:cold-inducible RNA-binding protein
MNIFVSGLPFSLSSDELTQLFSKHGAVDSAKVITDRETGRSRGFGFVEMPNDDEANNAISALNEQEVNGRRISVKVAEDRPKKSFGGGNDRGGRSGGFKPRFDRGNRY